MWKNRAFAANTNISTVIFAESPLVEVTVIIHSLFEAFYSLNKKINVKEYWLLKGRSLDVVPVVGLEPTRLFNGGF